MPSGFAGACCRKNGEFWGKWAKAIALHICYTLKLARFSILLLHHGPTFPLSILASPAWNHT